jgi:hypothetical protein
VQEDFAMLRRRRPTREIEFSFDSFLDLVANVVGIILRLILVAWVAARSYHAVVPTEPVEDTPALAEPIPLPDPTDPRIGDLEKRRQTLATRADDLKKQLSETKALAGTRTILETELAELMARDSELAKEKEKLDGTAREKADKAKSITLSTEELMERSKKLLAEIDTVRKAPVQKHALRYRTPVSKPLQTEQIMFEIRHGRITLIDTGALLDLAREHLNEKEAALRKTWQVVDTTPAVGAFRLRYVIERERTVMDRMSPTPSDTNFRYGLSGWEVVPIVENRGETADVALKPDSQFRRVIDALDNDATAVTMWVYADSFPTYRRLRDYLHERDVVVAGRPLLEGLPIQSSRDGTRSRGQ